MIFYIFTIAALTRLAGWGVEVDAAQTAKKLTEFFGKASCTLLVAFASLAYTGDLFLALIIGAGWLVWRSFGTNDRLNRDYERYISQNPRVFPFWFRVSYMGLRGFLSAFPLFIGISIYTSSPSVLLLAVPMGLQGVIYFGLRRIFPARFFGWWSAANEVVLGLFIASLITGAV
jgi:hypothetical protein